MRNAKGTDTPADGWIVPFYSVFAAIVAGGLCYFRHYLGGPSPAVFLVYWCEYALLAATLVFGGRLYLLWLMVGLLAMLVLCALSAFSIYALCPFGAGAVAILAWRAAQQRDLSVVLAGGALAAGLGAIYFLIINGVGYANVFLPERVLAGLAYPDTLFHTSLSSMLANYGELASPLNGLTRIRYHAFSHLWFGLAAKGVGLGSVHGYYLGLQIVALPLLLMGLGVATAAFGARRSMAALVVIPLGILFVFDRFDWMSYLTSESYMVGLGLLLLALPHLRALAGGEGEMPDRTAILALTYAILLSAAKISIGMTWTVAVVFLLLRQRRLTRVGMIASAILLILHGYLAIKFFLPNDNVATTVFQPLHFLFAYPLVAVANFTLVGAAGIFHLRDWRKSADRPWHEAVLVMLLVNLLPTLLLRVEGGSAYYFINVATWLAIASFSSRLASLTSQRSPRLVFGAGLAVILFMTILTPQKLHAYGEFKNQRNSLLRASAQHAARNLFDSRALKEVQVESETSTGARIAVLMRNSGMRPGMDFLVAVSPSFRAFWSLTPQCNAAPFLIPAYFGLPLLNGLPPPAEHCVLGSYYGYSLYGSEAQSRPLGDAALCKLTTAKGFHHTLIIASEAQARRLDCAGNR